MSEKGSKKEYSLIEQAKEQEGKWDVVPTKKYFRTRAHCNPLSFNDTFDIKMKPSEVDWPSMYPALCTGKTFEEMPKVVHADVGCGYGGLLVALSTLYPDKLSVGMEIREKVELYVKTRIDLLRKKHPGEFENISVVRTNAMKYLPCFFEKGQLEKLFFCFPDPQFKAKNFRRRIITPGLLDIYAYCLKPGAMMYTITDVKELHDWMVFHSEHHKAFKRVPDEDLVDDPAAKAIVDSTEEGQKVSKSKGEKHIAVFVRLPDELCSISKDEFWSVPGLLDVEGESE